MIKNCLFNFNLEKNLCLGNFFSKVFLMDG